MLVMEVLTCLLAAVQAPVIKFLYEKQGFNRFSVSVCLRLDIEEVSRWIRPFGKTVDVVSKYRSQAWTRLKKYTTVAQEDIEKDCALKTSKDVAHDETEREG
jgi:hypothetical protein